jgi:hypothetical protein
MRRSEPHWLLSDADARRYGAALANALSHLPVKVAQKYLDFSTLAFCVFEMELPRVMLSHQLAQARRPAPGAAPSAEVFQFTPPRPSAANGGAPPPRGRPGGGPSPQPPPPGPPQDFAMEFPTGEPEGFGP